MWRHPGPYKPTHRLKKMPDGLRISFRILPTARTDCLPTPCSWSSARARARGLHLVLMLEWCAVVLSWSWSCSSAPVLVRARASYVGRPKTSQVSIFFGLLIFVPSAAVK